jgi:hypothetical protein
LNIRLIECSGREIWQRLLMLEQDLKEWWNVMNWDKALANFKSAMG